MGYTRQTKTYRLVFDDPEMEGLEVRAKAVPVRTFVGLTALAAMEEVNAQDIAELGKLFDAFAGALVSWNLTELDDGGVEVPVPATIESVYAQDIDWMFKVVSSWMQVIGGVSGPLDDRSTGGGRSVEQSLPMAPLSASQPS